MSGGTTGTAKAALGAHGAYTLTGLQIKAWNASVLRGEHDVYLVPLPLFHVYANVGVQSLAFVNGGTLALVPNPRDLKDLFATIQRVKPTFFSGVPTLFIALLNHPDVQAGKIDFTSIRICFSGAAALLAETKRRFEALTGGRIVEGYSLTEAMMALCVNPAQGANKLGSVGMPLPDVSVRIYDARRGHARAAGEARSARSACPAPQLMVGYWNQPDETAVVLRDHVEAEDGTRRWLHTGDLGYLDEDGYLFIVDRKKDMIKTSGFQVWPREIEEALATHPAVAEVGVAGVLRSGQGRSRARVGRAARRARPPPSRICARSAASGSRPTRCRRASSSATELPKTMVGKVLRRALKDEVKAAQSP